MICKTCMHHGLCKFQEEFKEYSEKCNLTSEHADIFKVKVDCTLYRPESQQGFTTRTQLGDTCSILNAKGIDIGTYPTCTI